jgi:hypothetical protein
MSIYVLRSDNLVKIGFSDHLRKRLSQIVSSSPVPVEFVGHMPGDRELEAHIHSRFQSQHFSGEWFVENEQMRQMFAAILTPRLPELPKKQHRDRAAQREYQKSASFGVQTAAKEKWPSLSAAERVSELAGALGWRLSRTKDLYYGADKMALRGLEQQQVDAWIRSARALTSTTP